ncbi:MAG: hypothetical protein QXG89_06285 [Nitrososphaerota archaeon]
MSKRVKILEFENVSYDSAESLFYELQLSPESHAAGGITRHADGRLVITLAEVDMNKLELIKQKLGEPKRAGEKQMALPPPQPPIAEFELTEIVTDREIECPFCRAKLKLKSKTAAIKSTTEGELLNGSAQS